MNVPYCLQKSFFTPPTGARVDHSCATLPIGGGGGRPHAMVIGGSNHDGTAPGADLFDAELKVSPGSFRFIRI